MAVPSKKLAAASYSDLKGTSLVVYNYASEKALIKILSAPVTVDDYPILLELELLFFQAGCSQPPISQLTRIRRQAAPCAAHRPSLQGFLCPQQRGRL